MNRKTVVTALSAAVVISIGLTSCKKDAVNPSLKARPASTAEGPNRAPQYSEGIMSNNGYPAYSQTDRGYYQFWGPSPGQQPVGSFYGFGDPASTTTKGYGACTAHEAFVYKESGVYYLVFDLGVQPILTSGGAALFNYPIEEIEIHPQTLEVYVLAKVSNSMRIFSVDRMTGYATPVSCNGGTNVFNSTTINGYKSGSITFIPNASSTYDLVYTHESTVYASSGLVSWHFSISGTALTSIVADHRTYTGLSGTGPINTTYGNGNLYFTRDVAGNTTNALYTLSLATSNVTASTGLSIANFNDFGYWKAF